MGLQSNTYNSIHIERIDSSFKGKDEIDNVLVVFCAKPNEGPSVIVGWYNNATVLRGRNEYNGRQYNLIARKEDCVLLDENERNYIVPRAKTHKIGFGQSNLWYADNEDAKEFIKNVIKYIGKEEHESLIEQNIPEETQEFIEDGTGKKVYLNAYERNPKARKECIKIHGTKCMICGFDAKEIYGDEYEGKIHVHHRTPIHEIGKEYKVNPKTDLIPVCPNCHMILHTKIDGKEITVDELINKLNKK